MARRDEIWVNRAGGYIEPNAPSGFDILIKGTDRYLNWNTIVGLNGYGIRDNVGRMEFKHSGEYWTEFGTGGGGSVDLKTNQTPDNGTYSLLSGTVNGVNKIFTVSNGIYYTGTLTVYRNGLLQLQGSSDDWIELSPASGTFEFVTAPETGDIITVQYQISGGTSVVPGGSNTQVQFNDNGSFGGDSNLVWLKATGRLGINTSNPSGVIHAVGTSYLYGDASNPRWRLRNTAGTASTLYMGADSGSVWLGSETSSNFQLYLNNAIAMQGTVNKRFFFGGNTTPTATMHLAAGTAAASTAPVKLTAGTSLTTPEAGTIEYNGSYLQFTNDSLLRECLSGIIFTQTGDATISNSVDELPLIDGGIGTLTFPANFFIVGKTVRARIRGHMSTVGTPNMTAKFKLNSTELVTTGVVGASKDITDNYFVVEIVFVCRSVGTSGTIVATGNFENDTGDNKSEIRSMVNINPITIDTTIAQTLSMTFKWGTANAGNTITSQIAIVELLN